MNSLARVDVEREWLEPIPGQPPSLIIPPPGCAFHPRCAFSQGRALCRTDIPPLRSFGEGRVHLSACHFAEELAAQHVTAALAAADASS
jgi:oligopeptide/dipeptide ABC transporter ATP-binding protein